MKQAFSSFIFIFCSLLASSQTININWEPAKVRSYGNYSLKLPSFSNEGFVFDQNNVLISFKQSVGERDLRISGLNWQTVPDQELQDLNKSSLRDSDLISVTYHNDDKGRSASVNIGLFKLENGKVLRLSSFNMSEVAQNSLSNLSTAKYGTTNNPLDAGNFYKIKVDKSGIFKITKQFLSSNGIDANNINPKNFRIYGNGGLMLPEHNLDGRYDALQENAIQVVGEEDGVWNDGDYALFYAQGPNGYNLYNTTNGAGFKRRETRSDISNNVKNIYEDYAYYFINFDKGAGKRVQPVDETLPTTLISRFDNYQVINDDEVNLLKLGRIWVDDSFFTSLKTITLTTANPLQAGDAVRFRAQVIGWKSQGNSLAFNVNGQNPQSISVGGQDFTVLRFSGILNNITGNSLAFNFTPNISVNPNGAFYNDYIEIQYKDALTFNGSQMNFRDFSLQSGSGQKYGFSVANASGIEQIWDVSDITNATKRVNQATGNTNFNFAYTTNSLNFNNEFVAFRSDAAFSPTFEGKIENTNLSQLQNVDYLILTTPEMAIQANRIATYYENNSSFNVEVVNINNIYNEFGSGSKDLTAIRDFITKLNNPLGTLKYVFILGDATYDYKNRIPNNFNIVSSYQSEESGNFVSSFVTDDYIVMTKPQTTNYLQGNLPDVPVGRIPAANVAEAIAMIDKTLAYYNQMPSKGTPFGNWKMKVDFVVDDDNDSGPPFHNIIENILVSNFEGTTDKPEYNVRKLYQDAFPMVSTAGGPRYPEVNQAISNDIGNSLYLFYFGHGGINGWSQKRTLTSVEVQNVNNFNSIFSRFPLVSTITCEFTLWDEPATFSTGEQFIKHQNGGAATMITSSRAINVSYGVAFSSIFTNSMFKLTNDDFDTTGNSFLLAKKSFGANPDHLKVNFLGDPAMKMSRPKRLLAIDNIESPVPGLLRALDFIKITGHVNNAGGGIDNTFNGKVLIDIFDKRINKTTLNNVGDLTPVLNYTEEGGPIVKASGMAVNGQFTVEFYMPYDINYTVGAGRILAYADNDVFDVFNNTPHQVGDINPNGINDNTPPQVKLYMNNTNFVDGGITDQNPILIACVTDDTGINSTGAGIGHDITVYLDGEIINTIVLNDFYSPGDGNGCINATLKDYQKGNVSYPFRNLSVGEHTLTFKVWDINNNSTTETLRFIVKDEAEQKLVINKPLNWPNPFTNKTYIQFEHNCDDILDVNVQIFTISGRLVKTISQSITAEPFLQGFRTPRQAIEWDGRDDYGNTVGKGTYIFKIFARSQNQEKCKGGATATEKMVILK